MTDSTSLENIPPVVSPTADDELEKLQEQIPTKIEPLIQAILDDAALADETITNRMEEFREAGVIEKIKLFFDYMVDVVQSHEYEGRGEELNCHLSSTLAWLSLAKSQGNFSAELLATSFDRLQEALRHAPEVKQKLALCLASSVLSDEQIKQDPTHNAQLAGKDQKKVSNYLFCHQVQEGDVVLVDKHRKADGNKISLEDRALEEEATLGPKFSHAMIVSRIDPDGTVWMTHSTRNPLTDTVSDGVEEVKRTDYIAQYDMLNILTLRMPQEMNDQTLANVRAKLGKEYDSMAAVSAIKNDGHNKQSGDDEYNCVELIAESIPSDRVKSFALPRQLVTEQPSIFTPTYMATIGMRHQYGEV